MILRRLVTILLSITLTFSIIFMGCHPVSSNTKLFIGVSIVPEASFVTAVAGDFVDIVTVVPPGYSPATYEPTPLKTLGIVKSNAFFSIGVPSETYFLSSLSESTLLVNLADSAKIYYEELSLNGGRDPHVWLSVKRVKIMIDVIVKTLIEIDPIHEEIYRENAADYCQKLDSADGYIKDILKSIPTRKFIVFHPAFGYFANDYQLQMYAIEKSGNEATIEDLTTMIDFAKNNNITVVFNQAEVDDSWITSFTEEIEGGTFVTLSPLSSDYINNLKTMAQAIADSMPQPGY